MVASMPAAKTETQAQDDFNQAIAMAKQGYYALAAKKFRMSAMAGHGRGMFYLGLLFSRGDGVPQSLFHAVLWLSLAELEGIPEAASAKIQLLPGLTAKQLIACQREAANRWEQIQQLSQHHTSSLPAIS